MSGNKAILAVPDGETFDGHRVAGPGEKSVPQPRLRFSANSARHAHSERPQYGPGYWRSRPRRWVACRDLQTGRIIGFGCRSIREVYLNGKPALIGYLSSLRVLAEHRNLGLVARGYAMFQKLHADGQVPFYLTTIAAGNRKALDVLTSGRAGLPMYHPAGAYHTVAVPLRAKPPTTGAISVRSARPEDLPSVLDFLAAIGPHRQFFPRLGTQDFLSPQGAMRGLELDGLLLAERGGRLVGMLASWDQHSYRQSVVCGYAGWLRRMLPLYNGWAWLVGRPPLPLPGGAFSYLMGALPVVADSDIHTMAFLLELLRYRAAGGPWTHVMIGLHVSDPLLGVVRRFQTACYETHLFLVCWPDGDAARLALDGRVPYLEAGSL
jgi:hypothetical protein